MKTFLDYACQKYHEGNPVLTDEEFDRLAEEYNYERVGVQTRDGIPHAFPMFSLKKCYVGEKLIELPGEVIESPKLDGAAISLLYVEGTLSLGLTRGDGKRGQDITDKVRHLNVPQFLATDVPLIQITGEVVAPKSIPNARNYAAGALNLKDVEEFRNRELYFVAYGLQIDETVGVSATYTEDMEILKSDGFNTVLDGTWDEFPQDGKVFRVNDNQNFQSLGYTSSAPRGAYALKEQAEGVVTTLERVEWQVGRTGIVSPVAILTPVSVGDATVSRATLHNIKYIRELGLEEGCQVEIIRSGEIIPRVVRRV